MSTEVRPIKVASIAPSNIVRDDEIAIETAKTSKVTAVVTVMSIFCKKKCKSLSANPGNKKPYCQKAKNANFLEEISHDPRNC